MEAHKNYCVGIDVGTHSVGFAAIELDDKGMPVRLLNSMVMIHDSGVDPSQFKYGTTRLSVSGTARRTRRLIARRKKRLQQLDCFLTSLGWPIHSNDEFADPYTPWKLRARLATERLDGAEQLQALSVAIRHIARHRGWRNPYERIESLHLAKPPSELFKKMQDRVTEHNGVVFDDDVTPAEVVRDLVFSPAVRLRTAAGKEYGTRSMRDGQSVAGKPKEGFLGGKLMQSDNANEIRKIGRVQGLPDQLVIDLIDRVFAAESPKGKAGERAKNDELPGQSAFKRAPKAHPEFQRFRIISVVANLRIKDGDQNRRLLTPDEKNIVIKFLMSADGADGVTWADVAEVLGIERSRLSGTAERSADGERASSFPPVNTTNVRILQSKVKPLIEWWNQADDIEQAALVTALSNADKLEDIPGADAVQEFLTTLDDTVLEKLDQISLPAGRAAYSVESLRRLSQRMLDDSVDLFTARKLEFNVPDDWAPSPDPIGLPVGNPAVDRVLKIVNRWLLAAQREWGVPASVNVEHVRAGFTSEQQVRAYENELKNRTKQNENVVREAWDQLGIKSKMRRSDITRFLAIRRQNCQCAYCGDPITFDSCEMDHIVPRKGVGSTNTRNNLVAVCVRCNREKSNTPFAVWASNCSIPGVSVDAAVGRVRHWIQDSGLTNVQHRNFMRDIIDRLKKTTSDDDIDDRSMESVAWMAVELADRIRGHFQQQTTVRVFKGMITAEARKASGFEGKVELIGGKGKTRLDRRHHAMDAAVIALMKPFVAQTLVERSNIRDAQRLRRARHETWKDYKGSDEAHRFQYGVWCNQMNVLVELFNRAIARDEIPVQQNLRLRLGNSEAHDATIRKLRLKPLSDAWTPDEIDSASTPQMWVALTRLPDYDPETGLPENAERSIRVKNTWYSADQKVPIFPKKIAAIAVRGGYAEIGSTIHHARIYRIPGKKPKYGMVRVFASDLVRNRNEDLFTAQLRPESISLRTADNKIRSAVLNGSAEYLGWLVAGSELEIDLADPKFDKHAIGEFLQDFPGTNRWVVSGFDQSTIVTLRPRYLAGEGIDKVDHSPGSEMIFGTKGKGWRVSVGVLLSSPSVKIVVRDSLGRPRQGALHMPASVILKD